MTAELTAGALMVQRPDVRALSVQTGAAEALRLMRASGHDRLPAYDGSLDNILGTVHAHDLHDALTQRSAPGTAGSAASPPSLRSLVRPALFVRETKPAGALLDEMRGLGLSFAVVIDEYGATAGVLTLDDLLQALAGPTR